MTYEAHEWDEDCWAVNVIGDRRNPIAYCNSNADANMICNALNASIIRVKTIDPDLQALAAAALAFAAKASKSAK